MFESLFRLKVQGTDVKTEAVAGVTTFMTMAYIIFVNPAILSAGAQMDFPSVMAATCLASAFATLIMGLIANYPIALAPGMGLNVFFSFTICAQMGVPWPTALGMVFISGLFFTILTLSQIREMIVDAIPTSLKLAAAVGIGVFIAFIGLKDAGVLAADPNTFVTLGDVRSRPALLALFGLIITSLLIGRRIKGGIFWGILITGLVGIGIGVVQFQGSIIGLPSIKPTFMKLDIAGALKIEYLSAILILLFFDMFDTIGTLVGVGEQAGFIKEGKLPRASKALLSDSVGTMVGSILGTSTVTSYIESSAGVAEGGRTGLANVITALLFLAALIFTPLAQMFGGGFKVSDTVYLYPVTAPALIIVGCLMMQNVVKIKWDDYTESIPAFLTIILMPLTFSISHGLAVGFITYPLLKLLCGQGRQVHWLVYVLGVIFLLRYIFL
ncbi:MAG: NCS2 family permease [bacterium]|nr:NCS2 family permease [bacterium]